MKKSESMIRVMTIMLLMISQNLFASEFDSDFVKSAMQRTNFNVQYDGSYYAMSYPNGDVPENVGVCTDVVIRSYREIGTDLQQLVHEDMVSNYSAYPAQRIWGQNKPDTNIDHRRVPNLQVFFSRKGQVLPISDSANDYKPAELVSWMLPGNLPHIGVVTDKISQKTGNPLIVHNIGSGPQIEDMLFKYKITGHYKYSPPKYLNMHQ